MLSVLSSAEGSRNDVSIVPPAPTTALVDTTNLVFDGNDNEWYCFMVLKKPKEQDASINTSQAGSSMEVEETLDEPGMEGDDSDTEHPVETSKSASAAESSNNTTKSRKTGKREKHDTRTSIHCGKNPYGFVRQKNHESPLTVHESLLKTMTLSSTSSSGNEPKSSAPGGSNGNSTKVSGHDQTPHSNTVRPVYHHKRKSETASASAPAAKLAAPRQKRKVFSYHIVTIIGPFEQEQHARVVEVLWNFKSRAVVPRVVWAKIIADKFAKQVWHDMQAVFPLKYYEIVHVDQRVYLRLRRTWSERHNELSTNLEMFMRDKNVAPGYTEK